ncbi:MAG: L-seryl-tRNA(Sec) selenium transferase [Acidobacteriota bacterium]
MSRELLRQIKPVDQLLEQASVQSLIAQSSREFVRDCLRLVLDDLRAHIMAGKIAADTDLQSVIERELIAYWQHMLKPHLRPVINATGTLLHTNLGRAPLAPEAIAEITKIAAGYCNLEYNLMEGARGSRDEHCETLLKELLGCEAAIVVNNNAAAVLLVLDELAHGGEAIISRGEMIEIGGAFRIPDVMHKSGTILREVGTTNRTRLSDYEAVINEQTRLILRVHPSNYRIIGFTEKPALKDLVLLANRHSIPLVEDMGSGCLVDLSLCGITDEPTAQSSIAAGVAVVTFSGDKMLGGPQAGIIAGRAQYIARIRRNPLMRALRVDKLSYGALSATLQLYQQGIAWEHIPLLRALRTSEQELLTRARRFVRRVRSLIPARIDLQLAIRRGHSLMGGGSAPEHLLPTTLITVTSLRHSAMALEQRLRSSDPPVIARIEQDELVLDLRSVLPHDESPLAHIIATLADSL